MNYKRPFKKVKKDFDEEKPITPWHSDHSSEDDSAGEDLELEDLIKGLLESQKELLGECRKLSVQLATVTKMLPQQQ